VVFVPHGQSGVPYSQWHRLIWQNDGEALIGYGKTMFIVVLLRRNRATRSFGETKLSIGEVKLNNGKTVDGDALAK